MLSTRDLDLKSCWYKPSVVPSPNTMCLRVFVSCRMSESHVNVQPTYLLCAKNFCKSPLNAGLRIVDKLSRRTLLLSSSQSYVPNIGKSLDTMCCRVFVSFIDSMSMFNQPMCYVQIICAPLRTRPSADMWVNATRLQMPPAFHGSKFGAHTAVNVAGACTRLFVLS